MIPVPEQSAASGGLMCRAWHAPPTGMWKVNVNAAFFADSQQIGIGMVLRNEFGEFLAGKTLLIPGCMNVDKGEVMGFFEALSWVKSLDMANEIVEGDAKIVVDAIHASNTFNSVFGDFVMASREIVSSLQNVMVIFAQRGANDMAHEFSKVRLVLIRTLLIGMTHRTLWLDFLVLFAFAIMKAKSCWVPKK
ncbi:hypothetical protein ACS0TY_006212 [Phlomoides rotata]